MLYFAYGSNMDWAQMKERCPSTRFVGIATLADHRLTFTRKSVTRGCGVADVLHQVGSKVWGVVYEIPDLEIGKLDTSEGYRPGRETNFYWRRECTVHLDGNDEQPLTVEAYFAEPELDPPLPGREYMNQILSGARHWHLPADYIAELESIQVAG